MDTTTTPTTFSLAAQYDKANTTSTEVKGSSSTSVRRAPPSSIAVRLIPGAGRGVVALRVISKGTIVFEEEPYIMIPMANRRRLAVCICCGEQVVDKDQLNSAFEAGGLVDGVQDDVSNSSFASRAVAENVVSSGGVMCDGGCGECYCSEECMGMFHIPSHINTGSCAALRLCRPSMSKLNTVDYNHLRAIVAFGMKAKSEGIAGGYLLSEEDPHKKKKINTKRKVSCTRDEDVDTARTETSSSSSVTEDSDWEDLPNWKRNKLIAQRKQERKAVKEADMGIAGCGDGIQPVHIQGIQSILARDDFDGSPRGMPVINLLDEKEPVEVTRRRARVQQMPAHEESVGRKRGQSKRPVNEPLEVVCDVLVAAQIPSHDGGSTKKNLDDYYLTVDIQHPPKDPTFATAIAPLVTNFSEFKEEQLDSFRDIYKAYCDLFPVDDDEETSEGEGDREDSAGGNVIPPKKGVATVSSINDIVDITSLPVFSEYMFLKISAAFQCNGFSIYNTSLRQTHDREVGIGRETFHLPSGQHSIKTSHQHTPAVSPSLVPAADVCADGTVSPDTSGGFNISSTSHPTIDSVKANRCSTPVTRDLELLTGAYGYAGYFNHACAPNIRKTFGGPCGRTLQFVTTKDVQKGDQICLSYAGDSATVGGVEFAGANLRRWRLLRQYYFLCCCPLCERKK